MEYPGGGGGEQSVHDLAAWDRMAVTGREDQLIEFRDQGIPLAARQVEAHRGMATTSVHDAARIGTARRRGGGALGIAREGQAERAERLGQIATMGHLVAEALQLDRRQAVEHVAEVAERRDEVGAHQELAMRVQHRRGARGRVFRDHAVSSRIQRTRDGLHEINM